MTVQAHIFFSGIVQGVGFRYTTQRLASDLDLSGWVKNLVDGRVEIIAEGEINQLEQLIDLIEDHFSGSIQAKEVSFQSPSGQFKDFRVV